MYSTGNKLVICQLQNAKSNFPKFWKVYAPQDQKTNLNYYKHLVALIFHSKIIFNKLFWLMLSIMTKYTAWTYPGGSKRLGILQQVCSF